MKHPLLILIALASIALSSHSCHHDEFAARPLQTPSFIPNGTYRGIHLRNGGSCEWVADSADVKLTINGNQYVCSLQTPGSRGAVWFPTRRGTFFSGVDSAHHPLMGTADTICFGYDVFRVGGSTAGLIGRAYYAKLSGDTLRLKVDQVCLACGLCINDYILVRQLY